MNDLKWTDRALGGAYRASDAAGYDAPMHYAVEGLMPATGATIWFGTGSTGKTQLLLWLASHIAALGEHAPPKWLDADVNVRGHVLVITAEDLREHLLKRIGGIAKRMIAETGGGDEDVRSVCSRIHVLAFLSMTNVEFSGDNPCLFERGEGGRWGPSSVLTDIEKFIDNWNSKVDEEGKSEDRIVGVVLDSAVSMAGFELVNSEATTNFLFHLNRQSRRQEVFWAVIGHTPKDAAKKVDDVAIERLRGSAMWSTTPRSVVEVRLAGPSDDLESVRADHPGLAERDIVIVQVAKANSENADLRPRALLRRKDGAYDNITARYPKIVGGKTKAPLQAAAVGRALIAVLAKFSDGKPGTVIERDEFRNAVINHRASFPELSQIDDSIDGNRAKTIGTLAHAISRLNKKGIIDTKSGKIRIIDLGLPQDSQVPELVD